VRAFFGVVGSVVAGGLLSGCALGLLKSVHDYQVLEYSGKKGAPLVVEKAQNVILGFQFNTDYANEAHSELLRKCPNGIIDRIAVKHWSELGFFAYKNRIKIEAVCVNSKS
jgi:hypothetical protein